MQAEVVAEKREPSDKDRSAAPALGYTDNPKEVPEIEKQSRREVHQIIQAKAAPEHIATALATG